MFEAFHVLRSFWWRGWHYGPRHEKQDINPETGLFELCDCAFYAGDTWFVEAGHPRKDAIIRSRIVALPMLEGAAELLKEERYKRLLHEPSQVPPERELAGAGSRPRGRPAAPR